MNIDVNDAPLNVDLLYKYLLNTELFPVGYTGGIETYLEEIEREHERRGGVPATELNPLQALASCMKLLRNRGFFKLRRRNLWERIEFTQSNREEDQDEAAALAAASIIPLISS